MRRADEPWGLGANPRKLLRKQDYWLDLEMQVGIQFRESRCKTVFKLQRTQDVQGQKHEAVQCGWEGRGWEVSRSCSHQVS